MHPADRRRPAAPRTLLLLAATLMGLLTLTVALAPSSSAQGTAVSIVDNDYDPGTVVVATGTEVTWVNRGALLHDVVALRGEFRSRRFRTGESFSFVFNEPGTYDYQCTVHWSMSGTVEVRGVPVSAGQPTPTPAPSPAAQRRYSPSFDLGGAVERPHAYTLDDLRALPSEELTVGFLAGGQPQRRTYRGVRLLKLVNAAGPEIDRARNNDALRLSITVTATDGYAAVIAWGEIDPGFAGKPVLVAYEEDGQLLGDADGMARLVVPGDQRGGRYVSNINAITLGKAR